MYLCGCVVLLFMVCCVWLGVYGVFVGVSLSVCMVMSAVYVCVC